MVQSDLDSINQGSDMTKIKSGSHTRLAKYEACPFSAKLAYLDKIPEPERPLPLGRTEHANDRGTRIHEAAEKYVQGGVELIPELSKFRQEFLKARDLYAAGKASTEGDWAYDHDWGPVAWMSADVWVRIKCDLVVHRSTSDVVVVDYKSGRRFGNEIKHGEQVQLYVVATLLRYPKAKTVTSELWYIDQDELVSMTYTREQGLRFLPNFERRLTAMTTAEEFPPKPNVFSCRFCPYKPVSKGGSGHCSVGV